MIITQRVLTAMPSWAWLGGGCRVTANKVTATEVSQSREPID
jgi:hypothetical protein